jgi:hypothetical protein
MSASSAVTTALPELPAAWPADLCRSVIERSRTLAVDDVTVPAGPTLELWRPASRRMVRDAAFLATGLPRTGETGELSDTAHAPGARDATFPQPQAFSRVVSVAGLVHFADLPLALRGLCYLLAPDGVIDLVEPISAPGVRAFVAASVAASLGRWVPEVRHLHLHRDVATALRAEGLTLATIRRFTVNTPVPPLRTWMWCRAVRIESDGSGR